MTLARFLVLLALLPAALWVLGLAVVWLRTRVRVRGDVDRRRERLARMLRRRELLCVPTADVDLAESEVRLLADELGYRFLGYERTGFLRRRCGVFLRRGGELEAVMAGAGSVDLDRRAPVAASGQSLSPSIRFAQR